jgi:hypothetical protein
MAGAVDGPEPAVGAPLPPAVTGTGAGLAAAVRLSDGVRLRAIRFGDWRGFADNAGACTVTGGSASTLACGAAATDCA